MHSLLYHTLYRISHLKLTKLCMSSEAFLGQIDPFIQWLVQCSCSLKTKSDMLQFAKCIDYYMLIN